MHLICGHYLSYLSRTYNQLVEDVEYRQNQSDPLRPAYLRTRRVYVRDQVAQGL